MQQEWVSEMTDQALKDAVHLDNHTKHQIRRLTRLLSAYALHDPDTGYCQGMSDLAMPFLYIYPDDDMMAFWCFTHLMMYWGRKNFAMDDKGVFHQLKLVGDILERADLAIFHKLRQLGCGDCRFAYRMLVVLMKRELDLSQTLTLWEMMWADGKLRESKANRIQSEDGTETEPAPPGEVNLLHYFIAAVVCSQRRRVLDECHSGDDVLQLFQNLRIEFSRVMRKARHLTESLRD